MSGGTNHMVSPTRMKDLQEDLSKARYGALHTLITIATVVQITLLLRATLITTIITVTTLSSLTFISTHTSQRTAVTGLLRPMLRRQTLLLQYINLPSHLPALPHPLLLPEKMEMSKLPCTITQPNERVKQVLGMLLVKEAVVVLLAAAAM